MLLNIISRQCAIAWMILNTMMCPALSSQLGPDLCTIEDEYWQNTSHIRESRPFPLAIVGGIRSRNTILSLNEAIGEEAIAILHEEQ